MTAPALDDIKIVDLSVARAGPAAVRLLAEWGASVIRVEPPGEGLGIAADHHSSDYINLHGTGTDLNDRMETAAVKKCFGDRAMSIPTSSTKSMIGHPQGACGAAGVAATLLAMRDGVVPPTINVDEPDPECDLDVIPNQARAAQVEWALSNSFAFGGLNAVLALRRA